jgi:hypothetical protein
MLKGIVSVENSGEKPMFGRNRKENSHGSSRRRACQEHYFGMSEHAVVCEQCRNFPKCMRDHLSREKNIVSRATLRIFTWMFERTMEIAARKKNDLPDFSKVPYSVHALFCPDMPLPTELMEFMLGDGKYGAEQ